MFAGLALLATLGVGAIVGIAPKHEAVEPVHADPVVAASGTITVDRQDAWDTHIACKMAVYFYAGENGANGTGWSNLVDCQANVALTSLHYELSFSHQLLQNVIYQLLMK